MLRKTLLGIHERFISGDVDAVHLGLTPLPPVVAQSWERSRAGGVDPDGLARQAASGELAAARSAHPLGAMMPVIRQLLVNGTDSSGVVVAVAATDGTLLWVEGDRTIYRHLEAINFVPGADWSEHGAGTNAPGTALVVDRPVQIRDVEHFARQVQPFSCTAVPVHDQDSGAVIGVIDVTGGDLAVTSQALGWVRATAVAVENQLALARITGVGAGPSMSARLLVLGVVSPRWVTTDDRGQVRVTALGCRHAEILVLLSRHPEGLTADHLAMLLDEQDLDPVTVRAEMSRLRKVVGAAFIGSRPYRLLGSVSSDINDVLAALDSADVHAVLSRYRGLLLPRSLSPGIARLRSELSTSVRGAVFASGDLVALRRWLDLPEGREDPAGWQLLHASARGDLAGARAWGHLVGLNSELGARPFAVATVVQPDVT